MGFIRPVTESRCPVNQSHLEEALRPLGFLEADKHEVLSHNQRPLDQHAVGGEKVEGVRVAHPRIQLSLHAHLPVELPAGVEEAPHGKPGAGLPFRELRRRGVLLHDVTVSICNAMLVQPLLGALAGRALGVLDEEQLVHDVLLVFA